MSTCARNLPQHFNGCACTPSVAGVTAEASDVTLDSGSATDGTTWVSARNLSRGMTIIVDGEPRTVDNAWPVSGTEVGVDFESYDREPDGSPTAFLYRSFGTDEHFEVHSDPEPVSDETIYEAMTFAGDYCHAAGGARPGICYTAAWNVNDRFGWPIVEGERDGLTHHWNTMPDGRIFDPTAAQFDGDAGPLVTEASDHRYTAKTETGDGS